MKRKYAHTALSGILCLALTSFVWVNQAQADGTEQLGTPSIDISSGSYVLVEGIGLIDDQSGEIHIEIPTGVSISQVLLYWTGRGDDLGIEDTVLINGMEVTGPQIGGPTPLPISPASMTYRADITEISNAQSWIQIGQTNLLYIEDVSFNRQNDGAAVVVILDDGSSASIQIKDGNDFAWASMDLQTEPVDFPVEPSPDLRIGTMHLIVSDIDVPRPAAIAITVGEVTTLLDDVFLNNEGDFLDVVELEVPVPGGITNVTVQVLSVQDNVNPASLAWSFVSWVIQEPYEPPQEGCTYTIGFWKNHKEDWPTDELSLFSGDEAMDLLWTSPKKGNAYIILAHQYIGAELNLINGTSVPDEVLHAMMNGQMLLEQYQDEESIPKKSDDRYLAIAIANVLDDYNNGDIGPGHCD